MPPTELTFLLIENVSLECYVLMNLQLAKFSHFLEVETRMNKKGQERETVWGK